MTSSALPLPGDGAAREAAPGRLHALPRGHTGDGRSDAGLLARARAGDRAAFGDLVARHHGVLAGLLRQRLGPHGPVEDLLQDVFARSLEKLDGFGGRCAFATWAGTIALNLATDWQRKELRRRRLAPPADVEQDAIPAADPAPPLSVLETREDARRARAAIERLPLRMRLAVTLRIVEDLSYEQVAERLEAPVNTVRTWVSRGLRAVRDDLEVSRDDA